MSKLVIFQKFPFRQDAKDEWTDLRASLTANLNELVRDSKKLNGYNDFSVTLKEEGESKSNPQCRAIHKLCTLAIPALGKEHSTDYALDDVKKFFKIEFGFTREPTDFEASLMVMSVSSKLDEKQKKRAFAFAKKMMQPMMQPRPFASATKSEMMGLITKIEIWATERGHEEVKLTNNDRLDMVRYFDKLNK